MNQVRLYLLRIVSGKPTCMAQRPPHSAHVESLPAQVPRDFFRPPLELPDRYTSSIPLY